MALIDADLVALYKRKAVGFLDENQEKELRLKLKKKKELEQTLKNKVADQKRAKKARDDKKSKLAKICEEHPDVRTALKLRNNPGRPRIEVDQPMLLKTIIDTAMYGSAAHEKRQSDIYRSVKTLAELTAELKQDGFEISRSGVYLRLLPKRSNSHEVKRHTVTVPVRPIRAQNDFHSNHSDGKFCTATIEFVEEVDSILSPNETFFMSQDDKARVPIGLTAANKQSPFLVHVE